VKPNKPAIVVVAALLLGSCSDRADPPDTDSVAPAAGAPAGAAATPSPTPSPARPSATPTPITTTEPVPTTIFVEQITTELQRLGVDANRSECIKQALDRDVDQDALAAAELASVIQLDGISRVCGVDLLDHIDETRE
jgi:hypothetical protein